MTPLLESKLIHRVHNFSDKATESVLSSPKEGGTFFI